MRITDAILLSLGRLHRMTAADIASAINSRPEFEPLRKKWGTVKPDQVYAAMSCLRSKLRADQNFIEPITGKVGKNNVYQLTGYGEKRLRQMKPFEGLGAATVALAKSVMGSRRRPADPWPADAERKLGDFVQKKGRAKWRGRIVGWYRTELTALGYAVESIMEPGSVQIYPAGSLIDWDGVRYALMYRPPCGTWYIHSHKLYDEPEKARAAAARFLHPDTPIRVVPVPADPADGEEA